jgi:hypothetical protein
VGVLADPGSIKGTAREPLTIFSCMRETASRIVSAWSGPTA